MSSSLLFLCGLVVTFLSGWLIYDLLNIDDNTSQPAETPTPAKEDKKPPRFEIVSSIYDNKTA
jgi:hypothetical protein